MYLLALFSPLLSFIFSLLFGRFIGNLGVSILSVFALFISLFLGLVLFYEISFSGYICFINFYKYIDIGYFNINIAFLFDVLTSVMIIVVITISFLVHVYSIEYMQGDPCFNRFMAYLSIFTFFMLLLVTADNFMQMFIG
jgi:NADH:ubiquinone oxidoreductase subunit 5 (subunit L)/multisubunit Na+/H+ antiporter MnhA subunit